MPYIPEIYESQYIKLINDIKSEVKGDDQPTIVTRDIAIDYLLSENEEKENISLELLRDHNLRYVKDVLKNRLETWPSNKNTQKAFLFELLVEQEIDMEINFNGFNLNPKKTGTILSKPTVI